MKLGDFLTTQLASKLGLQEDATLKALIPQIANVDIDDSLAEKFNTGLMSLQGAKSNSELQKHFRAEALNSVDSQFAALADAYGIADLMSAEKNTFKKFDVLKSHIATKKAELEKKIAQGGGEDAVKLQKQIETLQGQLQKLSTDKDAEISRLRADAEKEMLGALIGFELNGKQYANKALGATNVLIARTLLDQKLATDKAILVNDGGVIKMKQAENPQMDFVDSGFKPVTFADYTNKLLADNKMLAVSPVAHPQPNIIMPQPKEGVDMTAISQAVNASRADLQQE